MVIFCSGLFLFSSLRHLGSFSSPFCCLAASSASFLLGVVRALACKGPIFFRPLLILGAFGWKHAMPHRRVTRSVAEGASSGSKKGLFLVRCPRNATKLGVQKKRGGGTKWATLIYVLPFFDFLFCHPNLPVAVLRGCSKEAAWRKHYKNRGFVELATNQDRDED